MQLASKSIHQARHLYQQRQFLAAWTHFATLPAGQLVSLGVAGQAADCAYRANQLGAAEALYTLELARLPANQPQAISYRFNLALVYFQQQNWPACVTALKKVQQLNPTHQRSAELLIQALLRQGHAEGIQEALAEIEKQLKTNPLNRHLIQTWAQIRWQQGQSDWCTPYANALQVPGHDTLLADYLLKLTSLNLLEQAEQVLQNYVATPQTNLNMLHYCYALLYYYQGKAQQALQALQKLPATWLSNYAIDELHIKTLLATGHAEQALVHARKRVQGQTSEVAQVDWALLASVLKLSGRDNEYRTLYDFDRFVQVLPINCPSNFASLELFHAILIEQLDALHGAKNHPIDQSLRAGSQTPGHLFEQDLSAVKLLELAIREQLHLYIQDLPRDANHPFLSRRARDVLFTGAWSVKLRKQGFHQNHVHNEGWISGCYYVQIPEAIHNQGQGWIKFGQIESPQTIDDCASYIVKPKAGHVVFFPSYMWHGTQPFSDDNFRITVAFDLIPRP